RRRQCLLLPALGDAGKRQDGRPRAGGGILAHGDGGRRGNRMLALPDRPSIAAEASAPPPGLDVAPGRAPARSRAARRKKSASPASLDQRVRRPSGRKARACRGDHARPCPYRLSRWCGRHAGYLSAPVAAGHGGLPAAADMALVRGWHEPGDRAPCLCAQAPGQDRPARLEGRFHRPRAKPLSRQPPHDPRDAAGRRALRAWNPRSAGTGGQPSGDAGRRGSPLCADHAVRGCRSLAHCPSRL
ncbi:hypothetical protein LTR94_026082, partial [Friedmanniomyces endolithicus]